MTRAARPFALGKLPAHHLERLLDQVRPRDPRVVVGPRVGHDAAVLDMGDHYLVAKSDPITFATDAVGWYAVHINANDIACTGATPRWFLATLLLPEGRADAAMVDRIFSQIEQACQEVGTTLVGGHTEITFGLDRPIVVGAMLGEVQPQQLVTPRGTQYGDAVVLTQQVAVEATGIIAREKRDELTQRHRLSADYLDRCAAFIYSPGISVVPAARVATGTARIHAMHDPTEGGLATGLWELAAAADAGLQIDASAVPIYPETRLLCEIYGLDPWGVIASGSLLLTLAPDDARRVCDALGAAGIPATVIGRVTPPEEGVTLCPGTGARHPRGDEEPERTVTGAMPLPRFARDEIAKLFE